MTSSIANKGFRPFFLLAATFAVAIVPIWLMGLFGVVDVGSYFTPTMWHAHEMIYGFAIAVIAGFLLTAIENWTGEMTARGWTLMALSGLWLGGRLAVTLAAFLPELLVAAVDLAFLPALVVVMARPLIATRNKRNAAFPALLTALWATNLAQHLYAADVIGLVAMRAALFGALDIVVMFCIIIGGRVIPLFTRNATKAEGIERCRVSDWTATFAFAGLAVATFAGGPWWLLCALGLVAGVAVLFRTRRWGARHTLSRPLLWVLHLGHAWIGVGLILRGVAEAAPELIAPSLATHALALGAIGTLTLGMMTRVALGHTGRKIVAGRPTALAFAALSLAVITRVVGPMLPSAIWEGAIIVSGALWSVAFALYLLVYLPILMGPRADGKPG